VFLAGMMSPCPSSFSPPSNAARSGRVLEVDVEAVQAEERLQMVVTQHSTCAVGVLVEPVGLLDVGGETEADRVVVSGQQRARVVGAELPSVVS